MNIYRRKIRPLFDKSGVIKFFVICLLYICPESVYAQVNKGVLGYDGDSDAGYVRLRGNLDNTIVYLGSVGDSGTDRDRGLLQLREDDNNGSETRAQLYLPSGRGQLQLDDSSNDLRVRLSASQRQYGPSSNQSYGYLDLMGGSSEGASIAWLGGLNGDPLRGGLYLREASGTTYDTRVSLALPSGRGQLNLDDIENDLRVRLSASNRDKGSATTKLSYGYLDLMAGSTDGGRSIVWLGASDSTPDKGRLVLSDASTSANESRATLYLPSGRGQLVLDDAGNNQRVLLSSSQKTYGPASNQSYGYLDLKAGSDSGKSVVYMGAFNSIPDRGVVSVRDSLDGKGRVEAYVGGDHAGSLHVKDSVGSVQQIKLDARSEGGEIQVRGASGALTALIRSDVNGTAECGVMMVGNSVSGDLLALDACNGEKTAIYKHPRDKQKQIYYSAMEGPEIGLYVRGRVSLKNGRARVELPEHFAAIVSAEGLSVQLTPHNSSSTGLAAVELSQRYLAIEELGGGRNGMNYEVSYLVQGVRAGKEAFAPVRDKASKDQVINAPPVDKDTFQSIDPDFRDVDLNGLESVREKLQPEVEKPDTQEVTPKFIEVEKRNDLTSVKQNNLPETGEKAKRKD